MSVWRKYGWCTPSYVSHEIKWKNQLNWAHDVMFAAGEKKMFWFAIVTIRKIVLVHSTFYAFVFDSVWSALLFIHSHSQWVQLCNDTDGSYRMSRTSGLKVAHTRLITVRILRYERAGRSPPPSSPRDTERKKERERVRVCASIVVFRFFSVLFWFFSWFRSVVVGKTVEKPHAKFIPSDCQLTFLSFFFSISPTHRVVLQFRETHTQTSRHPFSQH